MDGFHVVCRFGHGVVVGVGWVHRHGLSLSVRFGLYRVCLVWIVDVARL